MKFNQTMSRPVPAASGPALSGCLSARYAVAFDLTGVNRLVLHPTTQAMQALVRLCLGGLLLSLCLITSVWAKPCSEPFLQGQAPVLLNAKLEQGTRRLCLDGFTVHYSGVTRTPLWVAQHLTRKRLQQARQLDRQDNFHEEPQLPAAMRSTLEDYRGSGLDRGHMAPNGDMATRSQQYDSFSLANMVPQSPRNNREVWRNIEEATRALGQREGQVYVVTGGAFLGDRIRQMRRVLVPSHVWKAVYYPSRQAGSAYLAANDESGQIEVISLWQLQTRIGIDPFPAVSEAVKRKRIDLPLSAGVVAKTPASRESDPYAVPAGGTVPEAADIPVWLRWLRAILGN